MLAGGTHKDASLTVMTSVDQCVDCPEGTSCSVGSAEATPCLPGSFGATSKRQTCDLCPPGKFQSRYGQTACEDCIAGRYCAGGTATPVPCPGGTSNGATGAISVDSCTDVLVGFWAPLGSSEPEACPASGFYCPGRQEDDKNDPPGSKPILMPVGGSTKEAEVPCRHAKSRSSCYFQPLSTDCPFCLWHCSGGGG